MECIPEITICNEMVLESNDEEDYEVLVSFSCHSYHCLMITLVHCRNKTGKELNSIYWIRLELYRAKNHFQYGSMDNPST